MASYDKAKWHFERDFPEELDFYQAHVHTGLFLGWLIDRGLISEEFREDFAQEIDAFKARSMTGPEVFEQACGCLSDDMLNEEGNAFAEEYYCGKRSRFFRDYDEVLARDLPSAYHVEDTWENYRRLKERLDERFEEWKGT